MLLGYVAVGLFVADPLGTDAAGIVLHLPVQNVQLHSGYPGAAHVAVGISDEAAVLRSVAFCRHLHPQGVGGGVATGQVLEVVGSRCPIQTLIAQVRTFRLHNEGGGVAGPSVVIIRLVGDGKFRIKLAEGGNSAGNR